MIFGVILIIIYGVYILTDHNSWWLFILYFITLIAVVYGFKKATDKREELYGSKEEYHKEKLKLVREILKEKNLYGKSKIEILIEQYDDELPNQKITRDLFKPFSNFMSIGFIPILIIFISWLLKQSSEFETILSLISTIFALFFVLLGFYYLIVPIAEDVLDKNYKKMLELKNILRDIIIQDFLV